LDPQMRVARAALAALASFVEAGLGHLVDPVILTRDKRRADRADRAGNAHDDAGLCHPARPFGAVLDIGHALLQLARRLRDEQLGWQPRQVEMAIGRDAAVLHGALRVSCLTQCKADFAARPRYFLIAARVK